MNLTAHYSRRQEIPDDKLSEHRGKWMAFSSEGDRVIASSQDLESLRAELLRTVEDPDQVVLTHLPDNDDGMPLRGLEIEWY